MRAQDNKAAESPSSQNMHRSLVPAALSIVFTIAVQAHPSVSVVIDRQGNVFYSDLSQVWRVRPDGQKSVAVPGVHAHELVLDAADNLYGEHLWYEGEKTNKWGYYVWRRSPDGHVSRIVP